MLDQINQDLKAAMIAKDEPRKITLQGLKATIKYAEIDNGSPLDDEGMIKVLQKEAKKRKEAIELYVQGNNQESADREKVELEIIESYLPDMMSEADIEKIVDEVIAETGASSMQDMGKVMGQVNSRVAGQADGSMVASIVKGKLG